MNTLPRMLSYLLIVLSLVLNTQLLAQTDRKSKEISVGSSILQQPGDESVCFKNGEYIYSEIIIAEGKTKKELYKNVKGWISSMKISNDNITLDENDNNSISVNCSLLITQNFAMGSVTNQRVTFKSQFSFKDGKVKVEASQFMYYAVAGSSVRENQFHDLRPYGKPLMRNVYEQFDKNFRSMLSTLNKAIVDGKSDNW